MAAMLTADGTGAPIRPTSDDTSWAWWPGHLHGLGSYRHLLPVGAVPDAMLTFDPELWSKPLARPDRCPIATCIDEITGQMHLVLFDPASSVVSIQREPGGDDVHIMNTSVTALISSMTLYQTWFRRMAATTGQGAARDELLAHGTGQLFAVERAPLPGGARPSWWADQLLAASRVM